MAGRWSLTIRFINKSGSSLELTHSYQLGELVLLNKQSGLQVKNAKAKYVPTWILTDVENIASSYFERGYTIEKLSIKR